MNQSNAKKFAEITTAVMVNFGSVGTEMLMDLWFNLAIEDGISIEQWSDAARKLVRERRFSKQPTYADFREIIFGSKADAASEADKANEQVIVVMNQVRGIGSYGTPVFQDPITKRLMETRWSWKSFCSMTETEHEWWAKEFVKAYLSSAKTHQHPAIESTDRVKSLDAGIGTEVKS